MPRIAHVITTLDLGGTEIALWRLLAHRDAASDVAVISLRGSGGVAQRISDLGFEVVQLRASPTNAPAAVARLYRVLRRLRPDVVQTWLYHADVIGGVAARAARVPALVWGVRGSDLADEAFKRSTRVVVKSAATLSSRVPDAIVCVSEAARNFHAGLGYPEEKMRVIYNGFDIPRVTAAEVARFRSSIGVPDDKVLISRVARFHPHKDIGTFLEAAALLRDACPQAVFVLCGPGMEWQNRELREQVGRLGMEQAIRLVGSRSDISVVHAASDIACSSSLGEGFSNVVGEAMAAGTPVVATDVGDAHVLIGDTGTVVRTRDPVALSAALSDLVHAGHEARADLGRRAQTRIKAEFSMAKMAAEYADLYERMTRRVRHRRRP